MAIKPIDIRLDELNEANADIDKRVELASSNPAPGPMQSDFPDEGVQVAGLGSALKGAIKLGQKVAGQVDQVEIRKVPTLAKEAQDAADIQDLQKAGEATGIATPTESSVAGKIIVSKDPNLTPDALAAETARVEATPDATKGKPSGKLDGKPVPKAEFNLPLMDTEDSVRATVEAINNLAGIKTAKITFEDVVSKARESGIGVKFIDDLVKNKLTVNPENTYKALNAMTESAKNLERLAKKVAIGKGEGAATPEEVAEFAQTIHFHSVLQQGVKGYQTNVAQSLAAMRIPRQGAEDLSDIMQSVGGDTSIIKFAQAFIDLKDPMARADMIRKSAQGNPWEKLYTLYVNGLLSRPTTHIKNALSNAVFLPWRMAERTAATGIGALRRAAGLGSTDAYRFSEVPAMMASSRAGVRNGFALMSHAFKTGVPKGWDDPTKIARQQSRMDLFNYKADDSMMSAGIKAINYVATLPGRSLLAADELFKGLNYTQELAAETVRLKLNTFEDAIKAGQTTEEAMLAGDSAAANFLAEPPDYISELAEKGTFTQKLDGFGSGTQKLLQANTALGFAVRTQIPFIATPVNIMAETVSRSPLAAFSPKLWKAIAKGGTRESDMAMAKVGLGAAAMSGFASMATDGDITGSGPGDAGSRDAMMRQGWQPYSFVLDFSDIDDNVRQAFSKLPTSVRYGTGEYAGKVYVSYQGLEPIGALMAMSADYVDYSKYEGDNSRINEVAGGLAFGFANYMTESPFLQGIANIWQIGGELIASSNDKGRFITGIDNLARTFAEVAGKSVIPLSGALTSVKEKIDPLQRDYKADPNMPAGLKGLMEGFNKIRANIPGLSEGLPPKLNIWAEPTSYEYAYAPWRMKDGKSRPVDKALIALNVDVGMPSRKISAVDPGTGISASVNLTTEEYNEFLRIANKDLNLEAKVEALINVIEKDAGKGNLPTYQKAVKKVFSEVFNGTDKLTGAKDILIGNSKYSDSIQQRISDQAERLKQFGQGAK